MVRKYFRFLNRDIEGFYRPFNVTERYFEGHWTGEGSTNTYPRASWDASGATTTYSPRDISRMVSYTRLKNLQLGYNIPRTAFGTVPSKNIPHLFLPEQTC